jgi:hypothetical protein
VGSCITRVACILLRVIDEFLVVELKGYQCRKIAKLIFDLTIYALNGYDT